MNRENVEKAAQNTLNSFGAEYIYHKDFASKESFLEGYMMGAEWMDEQHTKLCVMETSNTENASDNDLIEECKRRGIFVKLQNQMIQKASKWLNENADNYISQYCKCMEFGFVVMFERAMKGE